MVEVLRAARSLGSMLLVGGYFLIGSIVLRLGVIPAAWLLPRHRYTLTSAYFKAMSSGIFALLTVGGARFRRRIVFVSLTPTDFL